MFTTCCLDADLEGQGSLGQPSVMKQDVFVELSTIMFDFFDPEP